MLIRLSLPLHLFCIGPLVYVVLFHCGAGEVISVPATRTGSGKVFCIDAFQIASNAQATDHDRELAIRAKKSRECAYWVSIEPPWRWEGYVIAGAKDGIR
jgi:hypothetical protein